MIDTIFLLKLVISFLVGSFWITYVTVIAQKVGSKLGGVIAGMPSTIVIGLFFIGWTQNTQVAAVATVMTPITMGVFAIFVTIYSYLLRRGFFIAISTALVSWFLMVFILIILKLNNLVFSLIALAICSFFSYLAMEHLVKARSVIGEKFTPTMNDLIFRGVLSGTIIAASVLTAKLGGPLLGGIFTSFPAASLSTMIIAYRSKGTLFSLGLMKISMISAVINVNAYALAAHFLYPLFGLVVGTVLSFLIAMATMYFTFQLTKRMT